MASSSYCFGLLPLTVLLSFLLASASTTKYIDAICQQVTNKDFCVKTLNAYPSAASATTTLQAAQATLSLVMSYADKSAGFAGKAAKENPNLKKQFEACQAAFVSIILNLKSAASELKESPETSNYDVMVCTDKTSIVKDSVGKNTDKDSKTVMMMTLMIENLLDIAVGATEAVGG